MYTAKFFCFAKVFSINHNLGESMFKRLIKIIIALAILSKSTSAENFFTSCRFHFGTDVSKVIDLNNYKVLNAELLKDVDYFTGPWAGSDENFNIGSFFTACKTNDKTPVVVAYIIAFATKRDLKIEDCNVTPNGPNLCTKGANYIRNNRSKILTIYATYAKGIASTYGTDKPVIWCMEPDYSQYTNSSQEGSGLTNKELGTLMSDIITTVKTNCPKSLFSMDISPWKDTTWQNTWYTALNVAGNFTFIHTSGGGSKAASTYISDDWATNLPTWAWVQKRWGKPMIADAGYGINGSGTGHDSNWDNVTNLKSRISEGAIGISQYNPKSDWYTTLHSIRSQLPTPPKCPQITEVLQHSTLNHNAPGIFTEGESFDVIDLSGKTIFSSTMKNTLTMAKIRNHVGTGTFFVRSNTGAILKRIVF